MSDLVEQPQKSHQKRLIGVILNLLGWGGGLFFITLIWKQASAVNWSINVTDWNALILAFIILIIGQAVQSQLAWLTQYYLGYPVDHNHIYRVWFFSQIAKYIPGSLWQVAARSVFYVRRGVPLAAASAATLWELIITITGSLVICLLAFILRPDIYLVSLGSLLLIALAIAFFMRWPWRLLVAFRIKIANRMLDVLERLGENRYPMLISLLSLSSGVWFIIGLGFYFLTRAFGASDQLTWWQAAISFNIAYSVGFLVIIAPTGLGVREVILSLLLAPYFDASNLAVFVLIARLWWISAEAINVMIAGVSQMIEQNARLAKING